MESSLWHQLGYLSRHFNVQFEESETLSRKFNPEKLEWDSNFFKAGVYKMHAFETIDKDEVKAFLSGNETKYVFVEVPAEATDQIISLEKAGFSLVETRLHYFHTLENLEDQTKPTRWAKATEIGILKKVASGAVNPFDRYHADPFFSDEDADRYLEANISNSMSGFAECVFVPDLASEPASFASVIVVKDPVWKETQPLYRIHLAACLPPNRGWHFPLFQASLHHAKSKNAKCVVMTTQATNRPSIHNNEKLGFRLGYCSLIFSISNR